MRKMIVPFFCFVTLIACNVQSPQSESEAKYAMFKNYIAGSSLLDEINASGKLEVCLEFRDTTDEKVMKVKEERFRSSLKRAVNLWTGFLKNEKGWKQRGGVSVNLSRRKDCGSVAMSNREIAYILTYFDHAKFKLELCQSRQQQGGRCRSHAEPQMRMLGIDLSDANKSGFDFDYLILHEFGHLLGLMDTYFENGYTDGAVEGQPDSVMNGKSKLPTSDDIAGIKSVWAAIELGKPLSFCGAGYVDKHTDDAKRLGAVFCVPKK